MKKKKYFKNISFWAVAMLLPIVILLSSLEIYAFNTEFYLKEFEKHNIETVTKIEMKDLNKITEKLINYLKDEDDNLNIQVSIEGAQEEVFGKREKAHMVDVKILFQNGKLIRNIGAILFALSLLYNFRFNRKSAYKSLLWASLFSLAFVVLLVILIQIDFYKYFTYFHEIFFVNDLWILNPKTDVLLQMLPLNFFINISLSVVGTFLGIMMMVGVYAFYKLRKLNRVGTN